MKTTLFVMMNYAHLFWYKYITRISRYMYTMVYILSIEYKIQYITYPIV
jgi:hypothetical protein